MIALTFLQLFLYTFCVALIGIMWGAYLENKRWLNVEQDEAVDTCKEILKQNNDGYDV